MSAILNYSFQNYEIYINNLKNTTLEDNRVKSITLLAKKIFAKIEHFWGYAGKVGILTRLLLNASIKTCHRFTLGCRNLDARILRVITRFKLLSIVGLPFTLFSIKSTAQKIFKSIQLQDKKGVALGSLTFTVLAADIIDSMTTFINAALLTVSKVPIGFFSTIGMPLAFGLVGLGSFSRSIQIAQTSVFFKNFKDEIIDKSKGCSASFSDALRPFFEAKIGITEEERKTILGEAAKSSSPRETYTSNLQKLQEKKKVALLREAPADAVLIIEKLYKLCKDNKTLTLEQINEALINVDKIFLLLKKKITIDALSIGANLLSLIGLCLFFAVVPAALPFLFLAASFVLKILILIYQDFIANIPK